jgi:signal transduction histidine kinase
VKRHAHQPLTLIISPEDMRRDDLAIVGESGRIEQLLLHLVQNAIDASEPGAPITLIARRQADWAQIDITDKGSGMSQRFIAQELFKPFRSTKPGGFGIGAYEAREIARSHGGRLEVESEEGAGSTFRIVLPIAAMPHAVAAQ